MHSYLVHNNDLRPGWLCTKIWFLASVENMTWKISVHVKYICIHTYMYIHTYIWHLSMHFSQIVEYIQHKYGQTILTTHFHTADSECLLRAFVSELYILNQLNINYRSIYTYNTCICYVHTYVLCMYICTSTFTPFPAQLTDYIIKHIPFILKN